MVLSLLAVMSHGSRFGERAGARYRIPAQRGSAQSAMVSPRKRGNAVGAWAKVVRRLGVKGILTFDTGFDSVPGVRLRDVAPHVIQLDVSTITQPRSVRSRR